MKLFCKLLGHNYKFIVDDADGKFTFGHQECSRCHKFFYRAKVREVKFNGNTYKAKL
jgi:hypothetical protein